MTKPALRPAPFAFSLLALLGARDRPSRPRVSTRAIFREVLRRFLVLLCAVVLIQETNLGSLFVGAECLETCPDDTTPGHCSPVCASCSCGTRVISVTPQLTRLPAPASFDGRPFADAAVSLGDTHLSDILHVPKRVFA